MERTNVVNTSLCRTFIFFSIFGCSLSHENDLSHLTILSA
uniref:Uncharacterized protein n=1 Tax=Arundo donax TaxID=35708 RepID=A0A0A9C5H7_ARUDO